MTSAAPGHASPDPLRASGAELLGAFSLVLFGCGAVMVDAETAGALGTPGIALAFGLVVGIMVYAVAHVSGAHFNPAVTLALAARGHVPWGRVPGYWAAQVAGAILAALALRASLGDVATLGATVPSGSAGQSLAWEALLTFALLFVIASVVATRPPAGVAALAVGGTIALGALVGGPISGGSMNPARSLAPALVSRELADVWIYLTAPFAGAVLGVVAFELVGRARTAP